MQSGEEKQGGEKVGSWVGGAWGHLEAGVGGELGREAPEMMAFSKGPSNLSVNLRSSRTKDSFFYGRRQEVQSANYRRRGKVDSEIQLHASNSAHGEREKRRDRRGFFYIENFIFVWWWLLIEIFILNNAPLQTISSSHQWNSAGSPIKRFRILNFPKQQQM